MELGTKVNGLLALRFDRVEEFKSGQMDQCMKDTGWTTRPMGRVD